MDWVGVDLAVGLVEVAVGYSKQIRLTAVAAVMISLAGCASLTSIVNPERINQPTVHPTIQSQARLEDPQGQQLAIAWETAKLAEQRGLDREAIAAYLEVRQLKPSAVGVAHALAVLYDRSGMTDAAIREYQTALQESPGNADVHCDYGYFLYSTGHDHQAEASLRQSLRLVPDHRQATINLALVVGNQGRYDEALNLFTQAIGPAAAMHNVGMLKLRAGETVAAQQMLAEASRRDPSIHQSSQVLSRLQSPGTQGAESAEVLAGHQDSQPDSAGRVSLAN